MSIVLSLIIIVMSIDLVPITESAMELARRAVIYGVSFLLAFLDSHQGCELPNLWISIEIGIFCHILLQCPFHVPYNNKGIGNNDRHIYLYYRVNSLDSHNWREWEQDVNWTYTILISKGLRKSYSWINSFISYMVYESAMELARRAVIYGVSFLLAFLDSHQGCELPSMWIYIE